VLNIIVVAFCACLLWRRGVSDVDNDLTMRTVVVLIVAAIHALYFAFVVSKNGVKDAARKYGRELILSTETVMGSARVPAKRKKAS